jgi:hypothetical protein
MDRQGGPHFGPHEPLLELEDWTGDSLAQSRVKTRRRDTHEHEPDLGPGSRNRVEKDEFRTVTSRPHPVPLLWAKSFLYPFRLNSMRPFRSGGQSLRVH